ncbi:MAG: hypothetical protein AB7N24_02805 [Dehalococcoidia bacterium]
MKLNVLALIVNLLMVLALLVVGIRSEKLEMIGIGLFLGLLLLPLQLWKFRSERRRAERLVRPKTWPD